MELVHKETLPVLALMDTLKTLTAESYITREDAEVLFGIGLQVNNIIKVVEY